MTGAVGSDDFLGFSSTKPKQKPKTRSEKYPKENSVLLSCVLSPNSNGPRGLGRRSFTVQRRGNRTFNCRRVCDVK